MLHVASSVIAFRSAVSGDGGLSSGTNARGADREGGEATKSRNGTAAGRGVLARDDALARDVVVGPTVDSEDECAGGNSGKVQVEVDPSVKRIGAGAEGGGGMAGRKSRTPRPEK